MDQDKIEELMDKYATGQLTSADMIIFDSLVESNPNFLQQANLRKEIVKSINNLGNSELRSMLDDIHDEVLKTKKPEAKSARLIKLAMGVAAVFLAGVLIYQTGLFSPNNVNANALENIRYAAAYTPEWGTSRSTAQSEELYWSSFRKAYNDSDYQKAIDIAIPHLAKKNKELSLLTAIASLETEQPTIAIDLLTQENLAMDYYYADHSKFYLALAYIQSEKKAQAVKLLTQLANDKKADHHQAAQQILEQIKG